jgi:uncharacterized protein DUF4231
MTTARLTNDGTSNVDLEQNRSPTEERLDDQINWYDKRSQEAQRRFKVMKGLVLVTAAAIPVVAAFEAPVYVAGVLGAVVVVLEGLLHAYQYHTNWLTYRSAAEALKREKYLYRARADAYAPSRSRDPLRLLARRIEGLISQEHGRWIATLQQEERDHADDKGSG